MSVDPQLIPVRKDPEIIRKEVLTNCVKMFAERGYINKETMTQHYKSFDKTSDNDIYLIKLDKPVSNDNTNNSKFNGSQLAIKILHQKVMGVTKTPNITEFQDKYVNYHKVYIFDSISDKARLTLTSQPNTEVFTESFLMINLVEHIDSPKYEVLSDNDAKEVLESYLVKKKELPRILTTDPVVTYFNLKRGQVIRIIRCSEQSCLSIAYRIVAKGST